MGLLECRFERLSGCSRSSLYSLCTAVFLFLFLRPRCDGFLLCGLISSGIKARGWRPKRYERARVWGIASITGTRKRLGIERL
jgi:hypothetical protein